MTWLGLEGKTVVVTGGASGIGKAVAQEYLRQGSNVVIGDLNKFEEDSPNLLNVKCDVSDRISVQNMIEETIKKFGKIDILVNNAGINIPRLLVDSKDSRSKYELSDEVYDKMVNINLKGVFICSQEVARVMLKQGEGVIVNMSSESGLEGSEGQSIYAATKNAVNSLTRSWAKELGRKGVRVVGIAPGILEATGLRTLSYEEALAYTREITVEKLREGYVSAKTTPLGRDGKLSEVADVVVYISSDRASYVHGTTLNVAGGKTRG